MADVMRCHPPAVREEALPQVSCVCNASNFQSQILFWCHLLQIQAVLTPPPQLCYFFWHLHKQILICTNPNISVTNLYAGDWFLQIPALVLQSFLVLLKGPRHPSNWNEKEVAHISPPKAEVKSHI